jgi:large subunit ribosomal protein L3
MSKTLWPIAVAMVEVTEKKMSLSNRLGLLGRKVGMMRLFTDEGDAIPVTVVDVSNNRVTQVKTQENDGYVALQVTFGARKASRVTKPIAGHLAKAGVEAGEIIQEFRVTACCAQYQAGGSSSLRIRWARWMPEPLGGHGNSNVHEIMAGGSWLWVTLTQ